MLDVMNWAKVFFTHYRGGRAVSGWEQIPISGNKN